jgi:hypothetical protein
MLKLTITFLAGALVFVSVPALAVDLPDYGSKNFSPSGDTPTYFANESAPVAARTADTTERDWSAVDAMTPTMPAAPGRSAHRRSAGHGKYHATHGSGRYGAGRSSGYAHSSHFAGARSSVGAMSRRSVSGSHTGKHGKSSAWQAGAAEADQVMTARG